MEEMEMEARFWKNCEKDHINCFMCPRKCHIAPGERGFCGVRENRKGRLVTKIYGEVSSIALDPIEKKPMYHFFPGSKILSAGTVMCNLKCRFCQNWTISQRYAPSSYISPEELVKIAVREKSTGIAYTYSEPLIWAEYVIDCSKLARENGLVNVMVSNGMASEELLEELCPLIDGWNIDLKGATDDFYRKNCGGGSVEAVLNTIRRASKTAVVEVTNLVIPTLNDSEKDIELLVELVAGIDTSIPLHFSRYHPDYRCDIPPTPQETLERAYEIAKKKLKYVYLGNILDSKTSSTFCPTCGRLLVERSGFRSRSHMSGGICSCGTSIYGRFA